MALTIFFFALLGPVVNFSNDVKSISLNLSFP